MTPAIPQHCGFHGRGCSGAERLLREQCPKILCEVHSENNRIVQPQFVSRDYECRMLDENHVLVLLR
jgi:hypothetical protein